MKNNNKKQQNIACPYWCSKHNRCDHKENNKYCKYEHRAVVCPFYLLRDNKPQKRPPSYASARIRGIRAKRSKLNVYKGKE